MASESGIARISTLQWSTYRQSYASRESYILVYIIKYQNI